MSVETLHFLIVLSALYLMVSAALIVGVAWAADRVQRRNEQHLCSVLDRFLARTFEGFTAAQMLTAERATQEVAQQEYDDTESPDVIAKMIAEAEATLKDGRSEVA